MKTLLSFILVFSLATSFAQPKKQTTISSVEWLVGNWTRINAKPGSSGFEAWTRKSNTELVGVGGSMKGADTTFVEKLRIVVKDGDLFYIADTPENKDEVWFKFTDLKTNSFVCENPEHDFPKKIAYNLEGNTIHALVSGDGKVIAFQFVKK